MSNTITITYGKKVPGAVQYSSESLNITLTQDLGAEYTEDSELHQAIDAVYRIVKQEVDEKLQATVHARQPSGAPTGAPGFPQTNRVNGGFQNGPKNASAKQVSFIPSLAAKCGLSSQDLGGYLQQTTGKSDPYQLTTAEAARVIDELKS